MSEPGSPEWLAERRRGIGASEIAAACGVSPHKSRFRLWEEKTGRQSPEPDNLAMECGRALEPVILRHWSRNSGVRIIECQGKGIACESPLIWATVDSLAISEDGTIVICEAKKTTRRNERLGADGTEDCPIEWKAQVQVQLAAFPQAKEGRIACMIDDYEMRQYVVPRKPKAFAGILQDAAEFWDYVANDRVPPAEWARTYEKLDRHKYLDESPEPLDWRDSPILKAWESYEFLGKTIRDLERDRESFKSELIVAMGDNSRALLADGRELVIETVKRKGHTVAPSEFAVLKARKVKT